MNHWLTNHVFGSIYTARFLEIIDKYISHILGSIVVRTFVQTNFTDNLTDQRSHKKGSNKKIGV